MKKIAVVLSGCGFLDGSEITEAISVLISLSECQAQYQVFAPALPLQEIDHVRQEATGKTRDVLSESARIARGHVQDLANLKASAFDGLVFPGGYGAAKNLSNWAQAGAQSKVHPQVDRVIQEFHSASKPICALCIAPVLLAQVLREENLSITIGNDKETAAEIHKTGAEHVECAVDDFVTDRLNKVITSPAYMYTATPYAVYTGIRKAVRELVEMS